ncbi:PASTA domain-containing protein [candidate division KSB1 bacterium]|nr:PASTA domain-containing protein [candidate division KSB1 bacterium]
MAAYCLMNFIILPLYTRHWQRVQVPDVTNLSLAAAEKILRHSKLVPMRGEIRFDDAVPAGYTIFQNPVANSFVKKGRRVYLISSKGKRPVTVPQLVGTNMRDAQFSIVQNQLIVGRIAYESDPYYPDGVVTAQSIAPETEVMAGSVIDMTVSKGETMGGLFVPDLYGLTQDKAELLLKRSLLTKGRVSFLESANVAPGLVIHQSLQAGERAARGDSVHIILSKSPQAEALSW